MARESIHKKLSRVRPPRVQISYDVEIGDAIQLKELPFVLGVLGDFSGTYNHSDEMVPGSEPLKSMKERRFVEVTGDNFDKVLASMKPHVAYSVNNTLSKDPDAPQLKVNLHFESLQDFEPEQVARNIGPLKELLELRSKLNDLRGNLQTNESLDKVLLDAITDQEKLAKLRTELGLSGTEDKANG